MKSRLFVSPEAEGPLRGTKTLFVVGSDHDASEIVSKALQEDVRQVYFGAGFRSEVSPALVWEVKRKLKEEAPSKQITLTVELPLLSLHLYPSILNDPEVQIIATVNQACFDDNIWLKIDGRKIYYYCREADYTTLWDAPAFSDVTEL